MKIVVKVGGAFEGETENLAHNLARIIMRNEVIVVHGGSADAADVLGRLGVRQEQLTAPDGMTTRYTTAPVLEGLTMSLRGVTQVRLVQALLRAGVQAVGLSGVDGGVARAVSKAAIRTVVDGRTRVVRDNLAGNLTTINVKFLTHLIRAQYVPLLCPPAVTDDGAVVNVDADRLAAEVALQWGADALILLTAVDGLQDAHGSLVKELEARATGDLPSYITGGMRMKVYAASRAALNGVPHVVIAFAGCSDAVDHALSGGGTRVVTHAL